MREIELFGYCSPVTITKLNSDTVAKSETLRNVRMASAIDPSEYIRTKTGHFVSHDEATLGRHILVPLQRMCASTYDEGECRRWEAARMADSQRERNSQKNTGTSAARLMPSLAKLGTSKSVPLMNSRGRSKMPQRSMHLPHTRRAARWACSTGPCHISTCTNG